jgi:hypothetical protein
MTEIEEALLSTKVKKDGHFNNYHLFFPNGAKEQITTVEAIKFLVAQRELEALLK